MQRQLSRFRESERETPSCFPLSELGFMRGSDTVELILVHHMIERCLLFHMTRDDCIRALAKNADIQPLVTITVWEELVKENKGFFQAYHQALSPRNFNCQTSLREGTHESHEAAAVECHELRLLQLRYGFEVLIWKCPVVKGPETSNKQVIFQSSDTGWTVPCRKFLVGGAWSRQVLEWSCKPKMQKAS
ncbi:hypothetical protein RHSIM_Rhsim08G0052500 [Rhododendron simsii]|uniref:Uncharacterized protein n=1 Tax=Rhododendron simsii TaxID=118357 RepID=A0A834GMP2_RHOSS|nr:hypothetical protein RHSIM_Rhsim08G0052500 [Rhododendron simsii]